MNEWGPNNIFSPIFITHMLEQEMFATDSDYLLMQSSESSYFILESSYVLVFIKYKLLAQGHTTVSGKKQKRV